VAALVVLIFLLFVPGALLRRATGIAAGPWGAGRFAVDASLSLALLTIGLLPLYLARAPVWTAPVTAAAWIMLLALFALRASRRREPSAEAARGHRATPEDDGSRFEWFAFAAAALLLVPVTARHAGANIDDWWDLSFVSGWLADGRFGFSQMALTADPDTHGSIAHPRFLWNVWLMLQATVSYVTKEPAWRIQGGALASLCAVLVVSAQAALARALFRDRASAGALAATTTLAAVAWIWGTEALPLFVRGYQDKLVAAFVLGPVLLACFVDAVRRPSRAASLAVAAAAAATVSVHSLVYTMALFACVLAFAADGGRAGLARLREHARTIAALAVPALYPLAQALWLAGTFGDQGVSLASRDNPVVRAHLTLNRLIGDVGPAWIVHPGAVFGGVALAGILACAIAWRRRRTDAAARVLLATTLVPCALMFVPGLAALAGKLWVPWMLYRFGWVVPAAPLLAYALVVLRDGARERGTRPLGAIALASFVVVLSMGTAADRLSRGMNEHPGQPRGEPWGGAAVVYDYLASVKGRAPVLAMANFSELVPAITGKPVVAFPERGTLVFSGDEALAYRRLRDRAEFFAASTSPARRDEIALRYNARWAVLPRRQVASGSETAWLWRFGPEAAIAARRGDAAEAPPCEPSGTGCRTWWSATRESAASHLSSGWIVVLETRDYFLAEHVTSRASVAPAQAPAPAPADARWLSPFELSAPPARPAAADVLASAIEAPGAEVGYAPPPRYIVPALLPVWADGPAGWEDAPMDARIELEMPAACRISAVEVVPHLPRERREVLELRADGRAMRTAARHNEPIMVLLDDGAPRHGVVLEVTSLLGNAVSLADVRLLGDAGTCEPGWPRPRRPSSPEALASERELLAIAPLGGGGRAFVSLARKAAPRSMAALRSIERTAELLREATRREPSLVEAWIELGFAQDDLAASAATPEAAAAARAAATDAFRGAVRADSNSAWARGALAWSEYRAGRSGRAFVQALAGASIDPLYADSWTVMAYALGGLRMFALAEWPLGVAERTDPARNWPALARADLAIARGDREAARGVLGAWIASHPYDEAARSKLGELESDAREAHAESAESPR
jgi:hypothetical protein